MNIKNLYYYHFLIKPIAFEQTLKNRFTNINIGRNMGKLGKNCHVAA